MKKIRTLFAVCLSLGLLTMLTACPGPAPNPGAAGLACWYALYGQDGPKSRLLDAADIPVGSMWTDGQYCYLVTSTDGGLIRMEGGTLHEGGGVCAFRVEDGKTLRVTMPEEGYTTFAEDSLLVTHQLLTVEVDSQTTHTIEVLVAYREGDVPYCAPHDPDISLTMLVEDEDGVADTLETDENVMRYPVAVLQRLGTAKSADRDEAYEEMLERELAFELADIHTALSGTYSSDPQSKSPNRQWTFLPDGRVQTASDAEAQPYSVELGYHSPTNVIRMPDGTRYAVLCRKTSVYFSEAVYDEVEEFWRSKYDDSTFDFELSHDDHWARPLWTYTRILTPAMLTVMGDDLHTLSQIYENMDDADDPIRLLNYYLLLQMAEEATEEAEEADDGS